MCWVCQIEAINQSELVLTDFFFLLNFIHGEI